MCSKKILALIILLALLPTYSSAAVMSDTYTYNAWSKSVPAPASYMPSRILDTPDFGGKPLKNASDVFAAPSGYLYISDTGNNRVLVLDKDTKLIRTITTYFMGGEEISLNCPAGLFVDNRDNLYIAMPDDGKVIMIDNERNFLSEFLRPDTDLLGDEVSYKPIAVVANKYGTVYVLVEGLHLGAVSYNRNGQFTGFYGANTVNVTISLRIDRLWKKLLSQEQARKMKRYIPIQFSGFDIDDEQFVYTCTNELTSSYGEINKLNTLGDNVLNPVKMNLDSAVGDYGDLERGSYMAQPVDTKFCDICIDSNGMIFALDRYQGRVFEYDAEGRLISIFGGTGSQRGLFKSVQAIDEMNGTVYVLDRGAGTVSAFDKTIYGSKVENAVILYNNGYYSEACEEWTAVLDMNVNCETAYIAIGKALYEEGKYREAMTYFEKGYDRTDYSKAFKEYRKETAKKWLPYLLTTTVCMAVVLKIVKVAVRKRRKHE